MTIFRTVSTDPYFNLASEEYLIDSFHGDVFMLWRNEPSVIIGRSQNAYAEVDGSFIERNGIKLVRRLSGGGAVFHDLGNVNFTFITGDDGSPPDFARFCRPIMEALSEMGIETELSGRNDIVSGGVKISGNAQARRGGRMMHHGTLLYSSDLSYMEGALRVNREKLKSKGVKSVRSRVGNLRGMYGLGISAEEFMERIGRFAARLYPDAETRYLTDAENAAVQSLADGKYSRWEWNWGESKAFDSYAEKYFPFGLMRADYSLKGGYISDIGISGDYFGLKDESGLLSKLKGVRFSRDSVREAAADISEYIAGAVPDDFIDLLFD